MKPFTRCMRCNGKLRRLGLRHVPQGVPQRVRRQFRSFARCAGCGRIYWPGTHYERLRSRVTRLAACV